MDRTENIVINWVMSISHFAREAELARQRIMNDVDTYIDRGSRIRWSYAFFSAFH